MFAVQAIRVEHTLPLWSPYILNDVPFLAQSAILAVLSADCLYYVLPVSLAWTLCLMLQMLLSAVFILVFERERIRIGRKKQPGQEFVTAVCNHLSHVAS